MGMVGVIRTIGIMRIMGLTIVKGNSGGGGNESEGDNDSREFQKKNNLKKVTLRLNLDEKDDGGR